MNTRVLIIVVVIVAIAVAAWFFATSKRVVEVWFFATSKRVVEVQRAELSAAVVGTDPHWSWWYHGSADGFHYLRRREDVILIPGQSDHYRIREDELAIPQVFPFGGWDSPDDRLIFTRGGDGTPLFFDPEWLEPPGGLPEKRKAR
jgi:hypothetical protein